ncbi:MAG: YgiT-type zinc finger protein [Candidatus Saganbacteria bacterium]|nr:YgiT-type zinc finger protein [Candidatus Saganbacteria bacterium]
MTSKESSITENLFNEEDEATECEACGGSLKKDKVNLEEFEGGKLYVMEQVPAYVCEACGEIWVPAPVLKEFEKMLDTAKQHKHVPLSKLKKQVKPTKKQKK